MISTTHPYALETLMNETLFRLQKPAMDSPAELAPTGDAPGTPEYPFLGGNKKNILFVIRDPQQDYFSEQAKDAFLKTLQALKLSLEDIAVYNSVSDEASVTLQSLKAFFDPKYLVFMDYLPGDLSPFSKNNIISHQDIRIVLTDTIEASLHDLDIKKSFWSAMKQMFIQHG